MRRSFAVIFSDAAGAHTTEQGWPLVEFLNIYVRPCGVQRLTTEDLRRGDVASADNLFIILPSSISGNDLTGCRYRRVFLADYYDGRDPRWGESDKAFLQSLTDRCFKGERYAGADRGAMRMMLLPTRLPRIPWWFPLLPRRPLRNRSIQGLFLGHATFWVNADDSHYHQRVEWMRDIKRAGLKGIEGGLIEHAGYRKADLESLFGDLSDVFVKGRALPLFPYYRKMLDTRVALCPCGHGRWTYRHYEAFLCGMVPVSTDLSATETLFPLKEFFSIQVTDHVDVAQTVRAAVERAADYQVQVDENYRRFVRLCPGARYRRMNRALFEKFIAQLED